MTCYAFAKNPEKLTEGERPSLDFSTTSPTSSPTPMASSSGPPTPVPSRTPSSATRGTTLAPCRLRSCPTWSQSASTKCNTPKYLRLLQSGNFPHKTKITDLTTTQLPELLLMSCVTFLLTTTVLNGSALESLKRQKYIKS